MSSSTVEPRDNERIAFAFPGVGITLCGREAPFYRSHLSTMEPYMVASSEACGMDLAAALEDGTVETFTVRDDIDLSKHKVGEKVVFVVTEAVALSVEKP